MTPGSRLNDEIENCCASYRLCVLPRNPKKLPCSVWSMPDPAYHVGVIWRQNTGAARMGRSFVRFGLPGLPDFQGWLFMGSMGLSNRGRQLHIEGKAAKDKISLDQAAHRDLCLATGVLWGAVASYDACALLLESWGLKR